MRWQRYGFEYDDGLCSSSCPTAQSHLVAKPHLYPDTSSTTTCVPARCRHVRNQMRMWSDLADHHLETIWLTLCLDLRLQRASRWRRAHLTASRWAVATAIHPVQLQDRDPIRTWVTRTRLKNSALRQEIRWFLTWKTYSDTDDVLIPAGGNGVTSVHLSFFIYGGSLLNK